jgi:hypothetical protein
MNTRIRTKNESQQKWIGLAQVKARRGNNALGKAPGAFVASIALAESPEAFAQKVTEVLNKSKFDVLGIEDIELLERRRSRHLINPDILKLAEQVTKENPVAIATFHSYES